MFQHDEQQWASQTFASCPLRDQRHRRRLIEIGACLARQAAASLSAACGDDDAARLGGYRLIENDRVDAEAIAEGGLAAIPMESEMEVVTRSGCWRQATRRR